MQKRELRHREFVIADRDEGIIVSYNTILRDFPEYIEKIKDAYDAGKTYIQTPERTDGYLEIQWSYK